MQDRLPRFKNPLIIEEDEDEQEVEAKDQLLTNVSFQGYQGRCVENLLYFQRRQSINAIKPIATLLFSSKPVIGPSD